MTLDAGVLIERISEMQGRYHAVVETFLEYTENLPQPNGFPSKIPDEPPVSTILTNLKGYRDVFDRACGEASALMGEAMGSEFQTSVINFSDIYEKARNQAQSAIDLYSRFVEK